ncbi:LysR family transcriptional regulator [Shewanella insulae]|uniref:LysR family transcriptional regulator n=1 Tax=Shewanella insulae TaxID=2681496 RepID=UPI001EFDC562|nr:LysR family transcriptional regulator [Shewanella insulae]MCG9712995.1 LysR family transcriptional regulator [Shewanella insulae]
MYHLKDLQLAIRIADLHSVSAAARELGMTPASASAALQRLEHKLNCQLFARSTRNMQLTEEGQAFIDTGRQALSLLQGASDALADKRGELRGELRIALPSDLGRNRVRAWLDELTAQAPELTLRLYFGDQLDDLIAQNVHLALRYGELQDSSLMRRQLARMHRVAVASPEYLDRHGRPSHPQQLSQHKILLLNRGNTPWHKWRFADKRQPLEVELTGSKSCNDGAVVKEWALAGEGIAYKSWFDVAQEVTEGRLELLLTDYLAEPIPLQLTYLQTEYPSHKVRTCIEFLKQKCLAFDSQYPLPKP